MLALAALFALLPALLLVQAQSQNFTFIEGLVSSLFSLGYSAFGQDLLLINRTEVGQSILANLSSGANFTVFVPSNQALSNFNVTNITEASDITTVANLIAYHIMPGDFLQPNDTSPTGGNATTNATLISAIFPNVTVGRTMLDNNTFVQLEGNKSQVLAWTIFPSNDSSSSNATTSQTILNQPPTQPNVTVFNTTTFENLLLAFVTSVIVPPPNITTVLSQNNLTIWSTALNLTTFTNSSGTNTTVLDQLGVQRGFTAFVPSDQALSTINLGSLQGNLTNLAIIVQNHIINDTTAYSPLLFNASLNWTSAAGEPYTFVSNSTGNFVTVGMPGGSGGGNETATAQIVQSDVLVSNGVVHIIDALLNVTASNPSAASSAFASASSAATLSTSATGPIGSVFTSMSSATSETSTSTETSSTSTSSS